VEEVVETADVEAEVGTTITVAVDEEDGCAEVDGWT
jgi:hypothetical protein